MATNEYREDPGVGLAEVLQICRRRAWWFAVPGAVGVVLSLVAALFWPSTYEAAAIVMVAPQEMPETIVRPSTAEETEQRFANLRLEILARDALSRTIDALGLFPDFGGPREEAVIEMRERIRIAPLPPPIVDPRKPVSITSFEIAYSSPSAPEAAAVANQLTRDFVAANLKTRASQVQGTSAFIDSELSKTKLEYNRVSDELAQYTVDHAGELPSDLQINRQRLDRARGELTRAVQSLDTSQSLVQKINAQLDELRITGTDDGYDPVRRKRTLELVLNQHYAHGKTKRHPDVIRDLSEIAKLEKMIADATAIEKPISPEEATLRRELRNHEVLIGVKRDERVRLERQIANLEELIMRAPEHQTQIESLETTITNLGAAIAALQEKKISADMSRRAELAQKGEKFRIVESAEVPNAPVSPNRPLFFVVGTMLGAFLGGLMVVVREMLDQSFHRVSDIQAILELPVLATIPVIRLPAELARARTRIRRLVIAGLVLLTLAAGGGAAVYLIRDGSLNIPLGPLTPLAKQEPGRV